MISWKYMLVLLKQKTQARMAWVQSYNNNEPELYQDEKERGIPQF